MSLTVKWIADNGAEMLYADAKAVSYTPPGNQDNPETPANLANVGFTFADETGRCHVSITAGEVYVMNDAGRTVAKYVLKTKEFPHGLAPRQDAA